MQTTSGLTRVASGYALLEAPRWDAANRRLLFCDGYAGGFFALRADGEVETLIPHRRGSGLLQHADGGYVVSGKNIAYKRGDESRVLLALDPAWGLKFFNDIGADLAGRVYAGSVDYDVAAADHTAQRNPGFLHCIDLDGSTRIVADRIGLSNGVGVSPDGSLLYLCDSSAQAVLRFELRASGELGERSSLFRVGSGRYPEEGGPDGLAVAADGSVWFAHFKGGCVIGVNADGSERCRIAVPEADVTSVAFGGDGLRSLYITTHCDYASGARSASIYRIDAPVAGMPVPLARVRA
jgi:sugar lactone lactonase YvrE